MPHHNIMIVYVIINNIILVYAIVTLILASLHRPGLAPPSLTHPLQVKRKSRRLLLHHPSSPVLPYVALGRKAHHALDSVGDMLAVSHALQGRQLGKDVADVLDTFRSNLRSLVLAET